MRTDIFTPAIARVYLRVRGDRRYPMPQLPIKRGVPNTAWNQWAAGMPSAGIIVEQTFS
jgi:hypothetical protein